jgi:hypothetical protein
LGGQLVADVEPVGEVNSVSAEALAGRAVRTAMATIAM